MDGLGMGPFNNNDSLKSVTDAVKSVLNQRKPQIELHPDVTPEHI